MRKLILIVGVMLTIAVLVVGVMYVRAPRARQRANLAAAGGMRLTYVAKPPEGFAGDLRKTTAAVCELLRMRVDPLGQRNMTWRVAGDLRIEIGLPGVSAEAQKAREELRHAETALRDAAVRPSDVFAVTSKAGAARQAEIDRLAPAGSPRRELLRRLGETYDALEAASVKIKAVGAGEIPEELLSAKQACQRDYDAAIRELLGTNIDVDKLMGLLRAANSGGEDAARQVKELAANYPAQKTPLDALLAANARLQKVGGPGAIDPEEVQRLLRGLGKLEFRMVVGAWDPATAAAMESLRQQGPRKAVGAMRWFEVDPSRHDSFDLSGGNVVADWGGARYVLLYDDAAEHTMTHTGDAPWKTMHAHETMDIYSSAPQVAFSFDKAGTVLFADLTSRNVGHPMAILLDDRAISAPNIQTPITGGSGIITFGRPSATRTPAMIQEEARNLAQVLNVGVLPMEVELLATQSLSTEETAPAAEASASRNLGAVFATAVAVWVVYVLAACAYLLLASRPKAEGVGR